MKMQTKQALLGTVLLFGGANLMGCPADDDDDTGADTSEGGSETSGPTTTSPTTTSPTTTSPTTTTSPDTTSPETTDPDTGPEDSGSSSGGEEGFQFADDPYDAYTQIDRHAAVEAGTAGILAPAGLGLNGEDLSVRDAYNASNPAEDAAGMWLDEIGASVTFFHEALDDDIEDLMLVPATIDQTIAQAGPVIVPDTIKYDPSMPTAYPNGRTLTDPVVDITLAAVLLELGPAQPLSTFADLPLNPPANDVPFSDEFPYLAPPH